MADQCTCSCRKRCNCHTYPEEFRCWCNYCRIQWKMKRRVKG